MAIDIYTLDHDHGQIYTEPIITNEPIMKTKTDNEDMCPHCDGTGIFVSCADSVDEKEMKCACQSETDRD